MKTPEAPAKLVIAGGLLAVAGALAIYAVGAQQARAQLAGAPLPAFVEDNKGGALVAGVPPANLPVSKSAAITTVEGGWPVPDGATVTAGFYIGSRTHQALWVVTYNHLRAPAIDIPTTEPHKPWVWHGAYTLVNAQTGQITATVDR